MLSKLCLQKISITQLKLAIDLWYSPLSTFFRVGNRVKLVTHRSLFNKIFTIQEAWPFWSLISATKMLWQVLLLTTNMKCQLWKVYTTRLLRCQIQDASHGKWRKTSVPPSLPFCNPWYLTDFAYICYIYYSFFCSTLKFNEYTLIWGGGGGGLPSLPLYSPQYLRDRIDILTLLIMGLCFLAKGFHPLNVILKK